MDLLIVEDDRKVREALLLGLRGNGYDAVAVGSAEEAIRKLEQERPEAAVIDIGLPGQDGYAVLREIRRRYGGVRVIILTARDDVNDRVTGLDAGADDYLVKPFAFPELLARLRAQLRVRDTAATMQVADLIIDPVSRQARRGDTALELTPLEFEMLRCFGENAGKIVTREMLATNVWRVTQRFTPMDSVIQVHVSHLRAKVDPAGVVPLIHTIRGMGYVLEDRS